MSAFLMAVRVPNEVRREAQTLGVSVRGIGSGYRSPVYLVHTHADRVERVRSGEDCNMDDNLLAHLRSAT